MPSPSDDRSNGPPSGDSSAARIGDFRILRKLGEGGMGIVYEAEQDTPRRRVALKVVRAARMLPDTQKRFEREAHVLGLLQHPGIAQIYHAGTADTEGGEPQPYFAMELVNGRPLTAYARDAALTLRQRLELLARVCDAVQHAHSKGVVHRDLKPGNILVVAQDGDSSTVSASTSARVHDVAHVGQPKILDFGLARITESDLPAITVQTEVGRILGTVQYMSPEQVTGESREIDARSDIYALGVIGYELVSGKLPHDIRGAPALEALRIIREDDAAPLSSVDRALRGDVETILAKALEKDPARRYASAADLAADLRRYLRDEPIVARPASTLYQVRKFAVRNKVLVGGVVAVFLALAAGLVGTAMGYVEARKNEQLARDRGEEARQRAIEAEHARDEATAARDAANAARDEATSARLAADESAAEAQAINEFLVQKMLGASNPHEAKGRKITLEDVLEGARAHVDESFRDRPLIAARLHSTLGTIENRLGRFAEAERHLRTAWEIQRERLGATDSESLLAQHRLATVLRELHRTHEALELQRELVEIHKRSGAWRSLVTALSAIGQTSRVMGDLAAAEASYSEALQILESLSEEERGAPNALPTLLADRASVYSAAGRNAEAVRDYERALALFREIEGEIHPDVARVRGMLATTRRFQDDPRAALTELESVLEMQRKLFPPDHPDIAVTLSLLAGVAIDLASYARAEETLRESLAMHERLGRTDDVVNGETRVKLSRVLVALGRFPEAAAEAERALASFESAPGDPADEKSDAYFQLALARRALGDLAAAGAAARKSLELRRSAVHPDERAIVQSVSLLAQIHHALKEYDQAEELYLEARRRYESIEGPGALNVAIADFNLGTFALDRGKLDDAETSLRAGIASAERTLAPDHPTLATMRFGLARVLHKTQRNAEAIELFRTVLDAQRAKLPAGHASTLGTLTELGDALVDAGNPSEAEPLLREAYDARKRASSTSAARLARVAAALGRCLAALERIDEAEPLLLEAHAKWIEDGKSADEAARVAASLAELYTKAGEVAEAERWRAMTIGSGAR